MSGKIAMVDKKCGRWTVLGESGRNKTGNALWVCRCDCGNVSIIRGADLRNGSTKSCGCLKSEVAKTNNTTHGMSNAIIYRIWAAMIQRCNNSNDKDYHNYGGRGITVCDEWLSFEGFFADMGQRSEGLTLERKNNELGYFKENCCWATPIEQSRNQRIRSINKTGVRGVHFKPKLKKYCVQIGVNHKIHHIGHFTTLKQATKARQQAEQKYWGKHV